jgi:hypothetical protein
MSDQSQSAQDAAAEFMRTVPVQDVIVSMVQTVFDVGYRRTGLAGGDDERDLEQTRVSIETVRALLPVLEGVLDAPSMSTLRGALSQLQLAYADATRAAQQPPPEKAPAEEPEAGQPAEKIVPERPPIWTPGGEV